MSQAKARGTIDYYQDSNRMILGALKNSDDEDDDQKYDASLMDDIIAGMGEDNLQGESEAIHIL